MCFWKSKQSKVLRAKREFANKAQKSIVKCLIPFEYK